jgi:hypothetical protein
MTYITNQGDMWDNIAFNELGDSSRMTEIIALNTDYKDVIIFSGNIVLELPEPSLSVDVLPLPPWHEAS